MRIWNRFSVPHSQYKGKHFKRKENGCEKSEKSQISVILQKSTLDFKDAIFPYQTILEFTSTVSEEHGIHQAKSQFRGILKKIVILRIIV